MFSSSAYDQNLRWRATLPDKTEAVGPFSAFYSLGANNLIHIAVPARTARPPILPLEDIGTAFVVKHSGQSPAYDYYEDEPGRRSAAKLLTKDEARRIAANIAKLPELVPFILRCTPCEARERLRPHGPLVFCRAKPCSIDCD